MSRLNVTSLIAAAALVAAACTGTASPSASTPSETAQATTQAATTTEAVSSTTTSAAATPVASVADDQLIKPGNLFVCIDIPYPPQEDFDENGNAIGSDPDIATEIGKRLGLDAHFENTVFTVIIPALTGNKCDIIVSAQNINADRLKQVDMIPYFKAGQSVVVLKGNPLGIKTKDDLCGKTIAVQNGTTELDYINGTSDYEGDGLNKSCKDAGKAEVTVHAFDKDNDAQLDLQSGKSDGYFADSPAAGYFVAHHASTFELSGVTVEVAIEGISVSKDHTGLRDAVKTALLSMISDGTYTQILTKWGVQDGAVTATEVNAQK
jgi:polar amino acid transport system substrate-binding protein